MLAIEQKFCLHNFLFKYFALHALPSKQQYCDRQTSMLDHCSNILHFCKQMFCGHSDEEKMEDKMLVQLPFGMTDDFGKKKDHCFKRCRLPWDLLQYQKIQF